MKNMALVSNIKELRKSRTGIYGLDEILGGGLPAGRSTLVCGGPGCGKTLLAMDFLVNGASEFGEPGIFMAFEETAEELTENVASLGFDLDALVARKLLAIHHVQIGRYQLEEAGEYDLEGLFLRLDRAIDAIKAKRVALDTLEVLFARVSNPAIVREALHRLLGWLKKKGVTVVVTSERGSSPLSHYRMEEYVSDCVISLDHRVSEQMTTRRIRVVKYRGAAHGTNEYRFLIGKSGISILKERAPVVNLNEEAGRQQLDLQRKRDLPDAQIAALSPKISVEEVRIQQRPPRQTGRSLVRTRRSAARLQR